MYFRSSFMKSFEKKESKDSSMYSYDSCQKEALETNKMHHHKTMHRAQVYEVQMRMDKYSHLNQSCPNLLASLSVFCGCDDPVVSLSPPGGARQSALSAAVNSRDDRDSGVDVGGRVTETEDESEEEEDGMVEIYRDEGVETRYRPLFLKRQQGSSCLRTQVVKF